MPNPPVICTFNTTSKLIDIVQSIAVITSPPALGAGAPIVLNASGQLDLSLIATPIPVPGGTTPQLQYDNAGVFAGLGGSAADGVNGLLTLTGMGTGVVLKLFGDTHGSDIQDWYLNGATLVASINQYGGLMVTPSAGVALTATGSSGVSDIAQFKVNGGTTAITVNTGGGLVIKPNNSVAAKLYGDSSSHDIFDLYAVSTTQVGSVDQYGQTKIFPFTLAPTSTAALTVTGDAHSDDIQDWYVNGGGSPIIKVDSAGNLYLVNAGIKDHTGTLGSSGQVLSSTGSKTLWITSGVPGGVPTNLQFNNTGAFAGINGSSVTTAGAVALAPTGTGVALTITGDASSDDIQDWFVNGVGTTAVSIDSSGYMHLNNPAGGQLDLSSGTHPQIDMSDTAGNSISLGTDVGGFTQLLVQSAAGYYQTVFGNNYTFGVASIDTLLTRIAPKIVGVSNVTESYTGAFATSGLITGIQTQTSAYVTTAFDHTINCNGTFTVTLSTTATGLQVGQEYY